MKRQSIAVDGDGQGRRFRVTHPFHPLLGREFELVTWRTNWGEDRVYYYDDGGALKSLPARWTSAVEEDPFVAASAGRACLRVDDLARLVDLVEEIDARLRTREAAQDGGRV